MSLPDSKNLVTVERLSAVIGGTNGVWDKTKALVADKADKSATVSNVAWDSTNNKITKTINGTTSDVVTAATIKTALSLDKSDVGLGNVDNTSDATKKTNFTGSIASDNTGFVTGGAAYTALSGKQDTITFDGTYSASTNKAATVSTVTNAIAALEVSAIAGAASKTLTSISETDGKISATYSNIAIAESQVTNLTTDLAAKAPLDSPTLTGTPMAPTATAGTNTTQIATTAFVQTAVEQGLATADALVYKGTVAGGSTGAYGALTPAASKGDVYKVTTAGKIDGVAVEVGDMLICNTDSTAAATSSNYSTIAANWDFIQTNLEGVVIGPASSTDGNFALFDGTTGKLLKNSSYSPSSFASSSHNHDSVYFKSSGSTTLVSGAATKIGTSNGADVTLTLPTIPAAANNGALNIGINGETATSKFTANQSTDSTLTFAEGATDGTIAVDGTDVAVHGLGSAAYTASTDYATSNHTHTASIATDSTSGSVVSLSANTQYKLTAGGSSVKFKTPPKPSIASLGMGYGTCNTAEATTEKTVSAENFALGKYGMVTVQFNYAVPANAKLNVNSTGAKSIYYRGGIITAGVINAFDIATFVYDGTQYQLVNVERPDKCSIASVVCNTGGSTAEKVGKTDDFALDTYVGIPFLIKFANANTSAAIRLNINGTGAKDIYINDAPPSSSTIRFSAGVYWCVYDGTRYKLYVPENLQNRYVPISVLSATLAATAEQAERAEYAQYADWASKAATIDVGESVLGIGDSATGVYIASTGRPVACSYSVNKTVPANAVFTDTVDPAKLGSGYGTCATEASTTAKAATLSNYVLRTGGHVSVKFTYAVPASATLNINSAGAKAIYYRGAAITAGVIGAGDTATFVYDGTQYLLLSIDSGEAEMTSQEVTDLLAALT